MSVEAYTQVTAKLEANRCLMCADPPCACDCPAGVDPRAFIRKIRFDNMDGAVRMLRSSNVLAGSCARICPSGALCGNKCTAKGLARPIDIRGLQRFVMDWEMKNGMIEPRSPSREGKDVAVIGAGPAGLGAAAELAIRGHRVTLFERDEAAGGMLRACIPSFRLPPEVVEFEIAFIKKLGVEIRFGQAIDDPKRLISEGSAAVFISTGLSKSREADFVGRELPGVYQALDLLRLAKQGVPPELGKRVVVIGGGDTALDAARVARKAGSQVLVLYRRTQLEMPAYPEEVDAAWDEGVEFYFRTVVHSFIGKGNVSGAKCVRVRWRERVRGMAEGYDVEGPEFTVACDSVVMALGQGLESDFHLRATPQGLLAVDTQSFATSEEGIFAGGDMVAGGGTAAFAVGHGKLAAIRMDEYLKR
ncbi:MAG: FAD-dependent oxidoreductase [bacterium]